MAEGPGLTNHASETSRRRPSGTAKEVPVVFGLLLSFRTPPPGRVPFTEIYRKHFDIAALAEDLGYDTIWLTEHHFIDDGYSPSRSRLPRRSRRAPAGSGSAPS